MSRYHRQTIFEPFGEQGQQQLTNSRVLICGCGALGGSVAAILARAGVGFLRLVDDDTVSLDNLHRQFLFHETDAKSNVPKVVAASKALRAANGEVTTEPVEAKLTSDNASDLLTGIDLLIDGTDNFSTRFLLNELALRFNKPLAWGGIGGASGQVTTVIPGKTPCLACILNPTLAPSDEKSIVFPVLSPIVQIVSACQATEAIKLLSGNVSHVSRFLTTFDLWGNRIRQIPLDQFERCRLCRTRTS